MGTREVNFNKFREIVETQVQFQFDFTGTFRCFIRTSKFVFKVWCSKNNFS